MNDSLSAAIREFLAPVIQDAVREALTEHRAEPPKEDPKRLLTVRETCDRLAISRSTLHSMRQRGEIQARRIGRGVRFELGDVQALAKEPPRLSH